MWDCRVGPVRACITVTAHETDVNVIHWNSIQPLIISGGDDGILKVWDLRMMKTTRYMYMPFVLTYSLHVFVCNSRHNMLHILHSLIQVMLVLKVFLASDSKTYMYVP